MLRDAETFAEEDKKAKEMIDARNALDNYLNTMKSTVEDPQKLADKLSEADKTTIKDALKEAQDWLSSHQSADKEEFED